MSTVNLALFLLSLGYSKIMQAVLSHVLYLLIESVWLSLSLSLLLLLLLLEGSNL